MRAGPVMTSRSHDRDVTKVLLAQHLWNRTATCSAEEIGMSEVSADKSWLEKFLRCSGPDGKDGKSEQLHKKAHQLGIKLIVRPDHMSTICYISETGVCNFRSSGCVVFWIFLDYLLTGIVSGPILQDRDWMELPLCEHSWRRSNPLRIRSKIRKV
ncbi:unnamed protein product [Ranitomeya imitator]|uniref:Transposase n=1 Tax=Ranitomeya imitator TaxID=111125 RepID=A0ABN9LQU3_9NEOB|nr:unnamed protein product [Ranitomeya imitator]